MTVHTYPYPEVGAPYDALSEDVKQGTVCVGDIVVFDWEGGARNVVRTACADGGFWLVDENVASSKPVMTKDEAGRAYHNLRYQMMNAGA